MSKGNVIFSHHIDAADYADNQKTCCLLPMRGGAIAFAIFFTAAGVIQLIEMIDLNTWHPKEILGGPTGDVILFILAACMTLSGVSGLLGAIFEIRFPITMCCILLLVQIVLEFCWFLAVVQDGSTHPLQHLLQQSSVQYFLNASKAVAEMIWFEMLKGNRDNKTGIAGHLFYTLFSLQFHLWATGVVASYALELRIAGKAVLFEPIIEDDEEDPQASLVDKKDSGGASTNYGATEDQIFSA